MTVPLSPVLQNQGVYPFVRLHQAAARVAADGVEIIDFGAGDPRGEAEPFIQEALTRALRETSGYPLAQGLPELREAIARWCARRFGAKIDPDTQVIPTLGSKEAIFSFAQVTLDPGSGRDTVVVTEPGYPVPERGARFAGANVVQLGLRTPDFLPDLDEIAEETWERVAVFWLNYPNNPTGAVAPPALYQRLAALARERGFVLASDEAYSELWFDEPPASALELADLRNVAVFNTLSKRSSMTGYRSGFVAGDPEIVSALRLFRPSIGTAPQDFVQRASIAAWNDEAHVERNRERYRRRRELFLDLFARKGLRLAGSRATMYLWLEVPDGETSEGFADRLLNRGIVVAPGSYLGESGEGYVRFALVPDDDACRRAAAILEELL
jgi:succinyldiaminopimelate transaminase